MISSLLFLTTLLAQAPAAPPRREALLVAHCPRQTGEYVGSYEGRVLLHKDFLGADDVRASIEHQLRYLWGHYRNDTRAHRALQVVLSAERPQIEILADVAVPYGRALELPHDTKDPRLTIEDAYTLRAVARGRVTATDPARLITYRIRFKLAVCGRGQDPPPVVKVPLPPDPWLAYWHVPRALHRPLRYFDRRAVTNPCADNDFADLPHPFYYWYDWLPTRHGPDDAGRPFDCRQWLRAGVDYRFFPVRLQRASAASHDFSRLRAQLGDGPLTATVLIGAVDHAVTEMELPRFRAALAEGGPDALGTRAKAALTEWEKAPPKESGTRAYFEVLEELRAVMSVEAHTTALEDGNLATEVRGRLAGSGRALRVRVVLGMTDVFGPKPPQHWRILRRALAEDQVVVYWGHAGIGENLRLSRIEQQAGISHQEMTAALKRSPLRLVAFLSCYSYMYFGQDLLEAGAEREDGAYFIFTGIGGAKHEAGPLAVLELLDQILAPKNARGRIERLPRLGDDEFWMVKEVAGKTRVP